MSEIAAEGDAGVIEEAGIGFDPSRQHLELSVQEKRRTTALLLAIQAYRELIIKDAAYLREATMIAKDAGREIKPARIDEMIDAALRFDFFIATGAAVVDGQIKVVEEEPEEPEEGSEG